MPFLPVILTLLASLYLLVAIVFFAARRKSYNFKCNTISELGELGARDARRVNLAVFLPVGLLLILSAVLLLNLDKPLALRNSTILLAVSLGLGYFLSGLIPCDPGCPLGGGGRQWLHTLVGVFMYLASAISMAASAYFAQVHMVFAVPSGLMEVMAGYVVLGMLAMGIKPLAPWRGLIQRSMEIILFGTLLLLMLVLVTFPATQPVMAFR